MDQAAVTRPRAALRRVLIVLCITEITSWGVLYYAFPVLAPTISASTGWPAGTLTAAFSASLLVSALVGIPVGRWLDRWGPRVVMTAGSVLAVPAVLMIARASSPGWFFAGWVVAGVAMAAVLYRPAFAALTRWWGPRRVVALTAVTLIAGLASTVFAPLTALLVAHMDWRHTYLVLAAVLAVVTIPLHALGLRGEWPHPLPEHDTVVTDHAPDVIARSRPFVLLAVSMSLAAFAVYAVVVNLVPLLTGRGMSTGTAALALGLGGAGQVCGRLGYARLTAATSVRPRTLIVLLFAAAGILVLGLLPGPAVLLVAVSVLVGASRGIFTLLEATAISDRWGSVHYGRLNGLLSAPVTVAAALAPWAGTALAGYLGGYPAVFAVLAVIAGLAGALAMATIPGRG
ncbi:Cyanate permease [Amycolatopsis xylanica]|uniref:Cyanate permease n=1 Tax=Amycolatopsis xylanica TaxID=589385 RepID=A0A1H3S378_9PSEU|nr:MFS transporter [Amycolatopsis xylanica]SDZ32217.1 Cyanate permease [Amycolatopsis xylanica]